MPTADVLAHDLARLAANLRAAADTGMRRELIAGIRKATGEVPDAIRRGLPARLPNRYAAVLDADLKITISVRTGATDPGVTILAMASQHKRKLSNTERGVLAHPLFGDREHWFRQPVTPGWFTGPAQDAAPRVREEIDAALERVKTSIWAGVRG
jgi:hypothetical protein